MGILGLIGAAFLAFAVFGFFFRVAASILYVGLVIGIIMLILSMFVERRKKTNR